jgi:uncharacterized protein YndB with AHSA1/START domain
MTAHAPTNDARALPLIDEGAPVFAAAELEIAAPAETVWDVLTAIERWPTWNPDVRQVWLEGAVAEGSVFRWKAGPGTITSTVEHLDRPRLIAWTGKTFGVSAIHVWRLEQRDDTTLVRTEESYEGLVASVLRRPLRKALETALTNGLRSLKVEAERRTAAGPR